MTRYQRAKESRLNNIEREYKLRKKYQGDRKVRFEEGDILEFTGKEYNLAKIFNYEERFRDKELLIEHIQRCPCEANQNDKIKFKGIERILPFYFF